MLDTTKPWCYGIVDSSKDENGYIPVAVGEDDPNLYPMLGNGPGAAPWYWGKTKEEAEAICRMANEKMGISEEEEKRIRVTSIIASLKAGASSR